ncbi:hypothetical protein HYFRA_00013372 [Hymenoscyphus fraxineus]|uniref:Uncharacterized protein n=1 Tax=Hymenoscyphus fraxineus TaxID=746836 RepID=A0A9N9L7K0_9HELO|nr:hypothetical protein HYFRA_00013372 [Hymenoscyphus fraxineus]
MSHTTSKGGEGPSSEEENVGRWKTSKRAPTNRELEEWHKNCTLPSCNWRKGWEERQRSDQPAQNQDQEKVEREEGKVAEKEEEKEKKEEEEEEWEQEKSRAETLKALHKSCPMKGCIHKADNP